MGWREAWGALWDSKAEQAHVPDTQADLMPTPEMAIQGQQNLAIFKSPSPTYLIRPPFGVPINKNIPAIRALSRNAYVFSATQTIADEIATAAWEIQPTGKSTVKESDIDLVTDFFNNPNGNDESFSQILRRLVPDILEIDAGVLVKSFTFERYIPRRGNLPDKLVQGSLTNVFAKDGGSFLVNPDVYGYMGNRAQYVPPIMGDARIPVTMRDKMLQATRGPVNESIANELPSIHRLYGSMFLQQAAYFQYPTYNAQLPVPFGRREVVYMMRNPRTDSHYGRGAVEMLTDIIYTLVYGSRYNLDFYLNNNMPEGVLQLIGANQMDIKRFKEHMMKEFRAKDNFGNIRKFFFRLLISSQETKFVPFQVPPQQMDILGQQAWFIKLLWACTGLNADEMGFTEDSNRATAHVQSQVVKRKVIQPILKMIEYHINRSIIPEFGIKDIELKFIDYDLEEEHKKVDLYHKEIALKIRSRRDVAEEIGLDFEKQLKEIERDGDDRLSQSFPSGDGTFGTPRQADAVRSVASHLQGGDAQEPAGVPGDDEQKAYVKATDASIRESDDLLILNKLFKQWGARLEEVAGAAGTTDEDKPAE